MGRAIWHTISNFVCEDCGMEMPLPRKRGKQREKGHIKDVFCPRCGRVSKFKEFGYKENYKNMAGEVIYM